MPWGLEFALTGALAGFVTFIAAARVAVVPVWWLYPQDRPIVLLAPVDSWGSALGYGALGLVLLGWAGPPFARALARRRLSGPAEREQLAERVAELGESRAASSATCTTARRRGWSPSPSGSAWPGRRSARAALSPS